MTQTLQATYMTAGINRADTSNRQDDDAGADAGDGATAEDDDAATQADQVATAVETRLGITGEA